MSGGEYNDVLDKIKNDSLANSLDKKIECLKSELEREASSMSNEEISSKIELICSDIIDFTNLSYKKYYNVVIDKIKIAYLGAKTNGKNNL